MMQSAGLWKVQLSRRRAAPSACSCRARGAEAGPSGSQRNGAATESMTTRRAIPRDSSTGTFLLTHSSRVSWRPVWGGASLPAPPTPPPLPGAEGPLTSFPSYSRAPDGSDSSALGAMTATGPRPPVAPRLPEHLGLATSPKPACPG